MAIGQMADLGARFGQRFSRQPTQAEWYLLGRHGLDGLSGMMANPHLPAWVAQMRAMGGTPDAARASVWSHLPPTLQGRFAGGPNTMTGDAYLGVMNQLPYAFGSNGWMPNWGMVTNQPTHSNPLPGPFGAGGGAGAGANPLMQLLGAARAGVGGNAGSSYAGGGSAPSGVWPWSMGGGGANAPAPGMNGLSAALGNR